MSETLTIGSLFSGYGGLELAMEHATGATPAWFVEIEPGPAKVLNTHWPDVPNLGDVTKVDWEQVEPVDIITAGYPCQPFSTAGKRKGTNDERHLWPHVLDAIRTIRPRLAFFENVRGHLNLGFGQVLDDLAAIGWNAEWTVNRASEAGAPHRRERLFILAYPDGERPQKEQFTGRPSTEITWDNDLLDTLAGLNRAADIDHELRMRWGDFGLSFLRWMLTTGRVPPPIIDDHVRPGPHPRFPNVQPATSPAFIEWLMGLPEGWVTDCNISRTQQIKALGNGVVPQQGTAALNELLERTASL